VITDEIKLITICSQYGLLKKKTRKSYFYANIVKLVIFGKEKGIIWDGRVVSTLACALGELHLDSGQGKQRYLSLLINLIKE
jgi:hypothetical protein